MKLNTRDHIAPIVEKLTDHPTRADLIRYAKDGFYHDFDTPLATPKMDLVTALMNLHRATNDDGYKKLANRVADGEFDEPPTRRT